MTTTVIADGIPFEDNIVHTSRHSPWTTGSLIDNDWWYGGVDLSNATDVRMTLCEAAGAAPVITLTEQADGSTQGLWVTYHADWISPDGIAMGASRIRPRIDEGTFEALDFGAAPLKPLVLTYDLLVTPSGEHQQPFCRGTFVIHPGVGD